ncbi:MAG: hypothetical protein R3217_05335 [Gammaproteobacteria bacterium]|nr:hypothetical protein [Gammaproteobacteria bacterium]
MSAAIGTEVRTNLALQAFFGGMLLYVAAAVFPLADSDASYMARELLLMLLTFVAVGFSMVLARRHLQDVPDYPARAVSLVFVTAGSALLFGLSLWLHFALIDPDYLQLNLAAYAEHLQASVDGRDMPREMSPERVDFLLDPMKQAALNAGTALGMGVLLAPLLAFRPRAAR